MEFSERKLLKFFLGETRMEKIRNENIRGAAHVRCYLEREERPD